MFLNYSSLGLIQKGIVFPFVHSGQQSRIVPRWLRYATHERSDLTCNGLATNNQKSVFKKSPNTPQLLLSSNPRNRSF